MTKAPISGFHTLPIASSKKEYNSDVKHFIGYYNSSGRIYLLCPFHKEKSPSLIVTFRRETIRMTNAKLIPDERFKGWFRIDNNYVRDWVMDERYNRFHCFGCSESGGNLYWLLSQLKKREGYQKEYFDLFRLERINIELDRADFNRRLREAKAGGEKEYLKFLDSEEIPF